MKKILIFLLFAFVVANTTVALDSQQIRTDAITVGISAADSAILDSRKFYSESFDRAILDSRNFYSESFDKSLQWLGIVIGIVALLASVFVTIPSIFNWLQAKKHEEKLDKYVSEMKDKLKEQFEKQEKEYEKKFKEYQDYLYNNLLREIIRNYPFSLELDEYNKNLDNEAVHTFLKENRFYYTLLQEYGVELSDDELKIFTFIENVIKNNIKHIKGHVTADDRFLSSLKKIIEYYEKTEHEEHLKILKETWKFLCDSLGGETKVLKMIQELERKKNAK